MTEKKPSKNDNQISLLEQKDRLNQLFSSFLETLRTKEDFQQVENIFNWMLNYKKDLFNMLQDDKTTISIDLIEQLGKNYDDKFKNILLEIITDDIKKINETEIILKKNGSTQKKG
jgi:hypothetical protein